MNIIRKFAIIYIFALLFWSLGYLGRDRGWWPHKEIRKFTRSWTKENRDELFKGKPAHHIAERRAKLVKDGNYLDALGPNYLAVTTMFARQNSVALIDRTGKMVKQWVFDISQLPGRTKKHNLREDLHGTVILPDGSVVANFEHVALMKIDKCSQLQWHLPRGHHSVSLTPRNTLWVPFQKDVPKKLKTIKKNWAQELVKEVSLDGKVLRTIALTDVFIQNKQHALLFANGLNPSTNAYRGFMHLNDAEELRPEMAAAFPMFKAGDLMVSLRNLNLVMVFDPDTLKLRWHHIGPWNRQHDPDFQADGTISVYNNNMATLRPIWGPSSIMSIRPGSNVVRTLYEHKNFYSHIRGKHTILPDGRILTIDFRTGRVFGVEKNGQVFLEYTNPTKGGRLYEVTQAEIVAPSFFKTNLKCEK